MEKLKRKEGGKGQRPKQLCGEYGEYRPASLGIEGGSRSLQELWGNLRPFILKCSGSHRHNLSTWGAPAGTVMRSAERPG